MQPPNTASFYEILEVPKDASPREIRRAYLRLAQTYHPDLNAEDENADRQFKRIRQTYEILSDPIRRAAYDEKPASFHLDESESCSMGPIIATPASHRDSIRPTGGSESFHPQWVSTPSHVGRWVVGFAAASLAIATTVGVAAMLLVDVSPPDTDLVSAGADANVVIPDIKPTAEPELTLSEDDTQRSSSTDPTDEGAAPIDSAETRPRPDPTGTFETDWWKIPVGDPEAMAKEWLSVESWDDRLPVFEEPEWTKISVPDLLPNTETESPMVEPEWARIPVEKLPPPTDPAPEVPWVKPEWAEIPVPDLSEDSSTPRESHQRPAPAMINQTPLSIGTLYSYSHSPMAVEPPNSIRHAAQPRPVDLLTRKKVMSRVRSQLRRIPMTQKASDYHQPTNRVVPRTIGDWSSSLRGMSSYRETRNAARFMPEPQDAYPPDRYIPPVTRYGSQLPDVPPAYAVPTPTWRLLEGQ